MRLLSTKILSTKQQQLVAAHQITLECYNAIRTTGIDFKAPHLIPDGIVTSSKAVQALSAKRIYIQNAYVVGNKVASALAATGSNIIYTATYASELATAITEKYANKQFYFFCGDRRRPELPEALSAQHIAYTEVCVYKTELQPKKITTSHDGVLFFSPSGVESHVQKNSIENKVAFCIGNTTAKAAKKHTNTIYIAKEQRIDSMLQLAIQYQKTK
ncbi:MAG: uroporphyrinogen-III synthase [Flavobacteriaceae bacterium]|nr:uroporphyrinogen-III synthase [Flavobacteriaceae bacterium]